MDFLVSLTASSGDPKAASNQAHVAAGEISDEGWKDW